MEIFHVLIHSPAGRSRKPGASSGFPSWVAGAIFLQGARSRMEARRHKLYLQCHNASPIHREPLNTSLF